MLLKNISPSLRDSLPSSQPHPGGYGISVGCHRFPPDRRRAGPTFVEIDTRKAAGPPIAEDAVLRSVEFNLNGEAAAHALEVVGDAMVKEAQKLRDQDQPQPLASSK